MNVINNHFTTVWLKASVTWEQTPVRRVLGVIRAFDRLRIECVPHRHTYSVLMSDTNTDQISETAAPLKDGAQSFGSFFPKNYVLAVFKSEADAAPAGDALRAAGFGTEDVIVTAGKDVVDFDAAAHSEQGLLARLGEKWSRLYTDEAADAEALIDLARSGAAFVLAYAPDDALTARATGVLKPLRPMVLRKYDTLKITELGVE